MTDTPPISRRAVLAGAGTAATLALAGCAGLQRRVASINEPAGPSAGGHDPAAWTFENLDPWRPHDGVALAADTATSVQGSQSARIEGGSGSISRHFTRPLDLSGRDLSLAVRVEQPRPTDLLVILTDWDGDSTVLLQSISTNHPAGWVRVSPSVDRANADLGKVSSLTVSLSGDGGKRYWLDDLRFPERDGDGARMLFTFDFATRDVYETAFPAMEEHDLVGTASVPTGRVGEAGRLTWDELAELRDAGWEIASGSTGLTSLHGLPEGEQRTRVAEATATLEDRGLGPARAFAYPKGGCDATTQAVVAEHHDLGFLSFRDSEKGLSQRTLPAPYFVNRSQPSTAAAAANQIAPAVDYGGVYAAFWWVLEDVEGKTSPDEFREICAHAADADGLDVVTPSALLD